MRRGRERDLRARPTISVILPVRDDPEGLATTLSALQAQTYPGDRVQVVIADNGSAPPVPPIPGVVVVRIEAPGSYSARNGALTAASGDLIAFTDAGCIPRPDWLERGADALNGSTGDIAVAGRIESSFRVAQVPSCFELYDSLTAFPQERFVRRHGFGVTANLLTTASTMRSIGAFEPSLLSGGDCEWGHRLTDTGGRVQYAPDVVVVHPARTTFGSILRRGLRVTIGTWRSLERFEQPRQSMLDYTWEHLIKRPLGLCRAVAHGGPLRRFRYRFCIVSIYFVIKGAQVLERIRVRLGGAPRR